MASQVGTAVLFGIPGGPGPLSSGLAGLAGVPTQDSVEDEASKHISKDMQGETIGVVFWDFRTKCTVHFYPTGGPGVNAGSLTLPEPGTNISLAVPGFDGEWTYEGGGTIEFAQEGVCKMVLPAYRYDPNFFGKP